MREVFMNAYLRKIASSRDVDELCTSVHEAKDLFIQALPSTERAAYIERLDTAFDNQADFLGLVAEEECYWEDEDED